MKIWHSLKNIYKEHKAIYIIGTVFLTVGILLFYVLPYLRFMMMFGAFCGCCIIIYGLLLHFERSQLHAVSAAAHVLRLCAITLTAVFVLLLIVTETLIFGSIHRKSVPCDYVLVLGCGVNGTQPSLMLKYRLDTALSYLNENPQSTAVLCGGRGSGEEITEAEAMANYLAANGIENERIIKEELSTDTRENITNAYSMICSIEDHVPAITVISSDFHLYRAGLITKKQGFSTVYTLAAPTPNLPLMHFNYFLREFFSISLEFLNI